MILMSRSREEEPRFTYLHARAYLVSGSATMVRVIMYVNRAPANATGAATGYT